MYEWVVELGPDVDAAEHARSRPARPTRRSEQRRDLRVHRQRQPHAAAEPHLRVRPRRHRVQLLHLARAVLRPHARHARAAGPRPRRRRQLRPDAGALRVDRRAAAGHDDPHRPGRDRPRARSATFTFAADVPGSTFQCWLDGAASGPCTSPKTYTGLAARRAPLRRPGDRPRRHERAGLGGVGVGRSATPRRRSRRSRRDRTSRPRALSATLRLLAPTRPDVTFLCSLDGAEPAAVHVAARRIARLHPGEHRFEVLAAQPAAVRRRSASRSSRSTSRSRPSTSGRSSTSTPPDTTISYGPPATTASINAYFGFSSDDPTAIIECSLDGEGFSECEPPVVSRGPARSARTRCVARAGRPGRQRRPDPGDATLDDRPAPAEHAGRDERDRRAADARRHRATRRSPSSRSASPARRRSTRSTAAPPLPPGYARPAARFYDVSTTADYGEPVTLCIPYDPARLPGQRRSGCSTSTASLWIDITTMNDPFAGVVCGAPESFSPFAIAAGSGVDAARVDHLRAAEPELQRHARPSRSGPTSPTRMIQCSIDGLPFAPCTSPVTYTHLEAATTSSWSRRSAPMGRSQLDADPLRVGGHPAGRHDAARHDDHQGAAGR